MSDTKRIDILQQEYKELYKDSGLYKVYCAVCFKYVEIYLAGTPHDFRDYLTCCPCKEDESVVIKGLFDNTVDDYGLFMISDLEPSISIIQAVLDAQGKPPMIIS
jgi:hypothetical protein